MNVSRHTALLIVLGLAPLAALTAGAEILDNLAGRSLTVPTLTPGSTAPVDVTGSSARRDDCDQILVQDAGESQTGSGSVEFVLVNNSAWWKGLELFTAGSRVGGIRANDGPSSAPSPLVVHSNQFDDAQIAFVKPKAFGVATCVYQLASVRQFANRRIIITWQRDRC